MVLGSLDMDLGMWGVSTMLTWSHVTKAGGSLLCLVLSVIITSLCIYSILKAFIKMMSCVVKISLVLLVEDGAQICGMIHSSLSRGTGRKYYLCMVKGVSSALSPFGSVLTTFATYKTSAKLHNPLLQSSFVKSLKRLNEIIQAQS